jgi:hypothetical protein
MNTVIRLMIMVILIISLAGCTTRVMRPEESPDSNEIVSRVTMAFEKVKHLRFDSTFTDNLTGSNPDPFETITEWKGTTEVDFTQQSAHSKWEIKGLIDFNIELYVIQGWQYLISTPPGPSYSSSGWTKTKIQDREWSHVSQIFYYVELLNTAQSIILSGSDNTSAVDCYVLDVSPSPLAMVDWMMAQDQPVGPQFNSMYTLIRVDAYQGGNIRLWIDKRTFRIIKAWIWAEFKGTLRPFPPGDSSIERFDGIVLFQRYDDTTLIVLPADLGY